jgi:hypothetical protein
LSFASARSIGGDLKSHGSKVLAVPLAIAFEQGFDLFSGRHLNLRVGSSENGVKG